MLVFLLEGGSNYYLAFFHGVSQSFAAKLTDL